MRESLIYTKSRTAFLRQITGFLLFFAASSQACAQTIPYTNLTTLCDSHLKDAKTINPKDFFSDERETTVVIIPPSGPYIPSGVGPYFDIKRYRDAFVNAATFEEVPETDSSKIGENCLTKNQTCNSTKSSKNTNKDFSDFYADLCSRIGHLHMTTHYRRSFNTGLWSGIYYITSPGKFITFGEEGDWFYYRTTERIGRFPNPTLRGRKYMGRPAQEK